MHDRTDVLLARVNAKSAWTHVGLEELALGSSDERLRGHGLRQTRLLLLQKLNGLRHDKVVPVNHGHAGAFRLRLVRSLLLHPAGLFQLGNSEGAGRSLEIQASTESTRWTVDWAATLQWTRVATFVATKEGAHDPSPHLFEPGEPVCELRARDRCQATMRQPKRDKQVKDKKRLSSQFLNAMDPAMDPQWTRGPAPCVPSFVYAPQNS